MSFEEALQKSAEAQLKLAEAMTRYSAVMERIADAGVAFVGGPGSVAAENTSKPAATEAAPTEKPTASKRGRPMGTGPRQKPAPEQEPEVADDDDAWGDEEEEQEEPKYTAADIRTLILKVRDKGGEKANAEAAKKILTALGVKSMSEIPEDKYAKAAELCNKALK